MVLDAVLSDVRDHRCLAHIRALALYILSLQIPGIAQ